jgi:hypothetical protein
VGDYTVNFQHMAYQTKVLEKVAVQLGQTTSLGDIRLVEHVYPSEAIEVTATASPVDTRSTLLGTNLTAKDYEALPVQRDYKTIAVLTPHANASALGDPVNIAGATGLENRYFVDGVDVTDPFRTAGGTNLPYNFVQEVQVRTGGYEAEYRSALGGTVNAVTYSGGNEFHGQLFGFFTSNSFSATPKSVPTQPDANQNYGLYDLGFGVGGPVVRDRLWYYAAYNPTIQNEDVPIPSWGTYQDHLRTQSFAGKLTWRANDRNTIVLTSIGDPASGRHVTTTTIPPAGVDPYLSNVEQGGYQVSAEGRSLVRDGLLIKSALSVSIRRENSVPETETGKTDFFFVDSSGVASGGGTTTQNDSRVFGAEVNATWVQGDQEVKAGVEYRDNRLKFDTHYDLLTQNASNQYTLQLSSFAGHVGSRMPSAFLQHAWSPNPRLQIHDGLRWSGEYWISSEGKVAQTILDEWQPRLGILYEPGHLGTQKVYASFGIFYQDITTAPLFWYYNSDSHFLLANYNQDPRIDPAGGDTIATVGGSIQKALSGLQGQYFNEFTLGYECQVGAGAKLAVRAVKRSLRKGLEDGIDPASGTVGLSNPGLGALQAFPRMQRDYTALEISMQGRVGKRTSVLGSYVLSRNYGNYEGLFDSRLNNPYPNATGLYDVLDQMVNATGLLPNDRTHVFKLSATYQVGHGLTAGMFGVLSSGTPVSEFGGTPTGGFYYGFMGARGSHGRTPAIWDLNLRLGYEIPFMASMWVHPRLTLDVLHVASQQEIVRYDEVHYRALDSSGNQIDPNPNYHNPTAYQPPMAMRLGFEATF